MEESKLSIEKELERALQLQEPDPKVGKCTEVLIVPVTKEVCQSFREMRRRAMCSAWEKMDRENIGLGPALKKAWGEQRAKCAQFGTYSEPEPAIEKSVELLDSKGKRAGTISLMKDGHVEFCERDIGCEVSAKPSPESYYLTEYFFSEVKGYKLNPLEV